MTITRNLTLEQQVKHYLMYLQELYPEIDIKSIYPVSINFPEQEDAEGNGNFSVTFNYAYWQDPAKHSETPKEGRRMYGPKP